MSLKKKKTSLPVRGSAFAVPLEDGRYTVCRVLTNARNDLERSSIDSVLVTCSQWVGSEVPDSNDPELIPMLHLTHGSWKNKPVLIWIEKKIPADFISIGMIEPTEKEKTFESPSHAEWIFIQFQALRQWRWDHDREALQAEDVEKKSEEGRQRAQEVKARNKYLKTITLAQLLDHQFFPQWKQYPPRKAITASRIIMNETIVELIELGDSATQADRMQCLQNCIESFNLIDKKMEFIETVEREHICSEFEAIVHACGLGHHKNLADEWRDW